MEGSVPTYQYACTACQHQFEAVQSFADDPLTQCPECEGRLRKLFGSVGVVFKGPGFYRTDSRNGSKAGSSDKTPASKDASGSKDGGSKDSGSKDSASKTAGGKEKAAASSSAAP
jgi:putative FmdB family regulatory protein